MSAHADKTLDMKIYNITDTNGFFPISFFKNLIFVFKFFFRVWINIKQCLLLYFYIMLIQFPFANKCSQFTDELL